MEALPVDRKVNGARRRIIWTEKRRPRRPARPCRRGALRKELLPAVNGIFPSWNEWQKAVRYGVILAAGAFVFLNARALAAAAAPFLFAFLLSWILEPAVAWLATRLRIGRGWSALIVLLITVVAGGLTLTWTAAVLVQQIAAFLEVLPQYRETLLAYFDRLTERATRAYWSLPPEVIRYLSENASRLGDAVEGVLTAAGRTVLSVLSAIPAFLTAGFLVLIATFFISRDFPAIKEFLWSKVPEEQQHQIRKVAGDMLHSAGRYLRAQAILITITTLLTTLGLWLAGIQSWLSAGLVIGILDLLPVVGPTLVFVPWIAYLFIVGNTALALSLLAIWGIASGARSLFEAKVVGDSVGLHPLLTLIAMYSGALLWGVKGIVLGPILFLLVKAVIRARREP